jgi:predicted metal-dependent phosphoesterase TrpH
MPEKIDMHVHSDKSPEAKKRGLSGVAICDHNYFHKEKPKFDDFIVLYGCEVSSTKGHIAVLGVDEAPTRDAEKLCEWVKKENGVAIPTHPFSLHKKGVGSLAFKIGTCVEKYNGTDPFNNAISFFKTKKGTGGSDAHHPAELGLAWTEFEGVSSEEDVLEALRKGKFDGKVELNPLRLPIAFSKRIWGRISAKKPLSSRM